MILNSFISSFFKFIRTRFQDRENLPGVQLNRPTATDPVSVPASQSKEAIVLPLSEAEQEGNWQEVFDLKNFHTDAPVAPGRGIGSLRIGMSQHDFAQLFGKTWDDLPVVKVFQNYMVMLPEGKPIMKLYFNSYVDDELWNRRLDEIVVGPGFNGKVFSKYGIGDNIWDFMEEYDQDFIYEEAGGMFYGPPNWLPLEGIPGLLVSSYREDGRDTDEITFFCVYRGNEA